MEAMTKQQEHERTLSSLQHDEHKKKLQRMVTFSIGGGVLLAGRRAWHLPWQDQAREARRAKPRLACGAQSQQAEEAKPSCSASSKSRRKRSTTLMAQLSSAQDDKTRAELKAKLAEAQKAAAGPPSKRLAAAERDRAAAMLPRQEALQLPARRSALFMPVTVSSVLMSNEPDSIVFRSITPTSTEARAGAEKVRGAVGVLKVGLELFVNEGPAALALAAERGGRPLR